ncbi:hypothetical protein E7V57_23590 [Escherichia coli]|nr:hypothetical protein [Shigella sonnei]EFV8759870.1 hypothetical protein [Shigella sonnei]MDI4521388.1 hypothetical protein [Escherichia coli]
MNFLSTHHFLYSCLNNFFEIEARNKESLNCTTPCVGLAQIRKCEFAPPFGLLRNPLPQTCARVISVRHSSSAFIAALYLSSVIS